MAQPREALDNLGQHQRRAVTVLDVGGVDHGMNEIAIGVGEDVALAPLDLLACIIAARTARFCGFHALTVDHPGAGRCFAANYLSSDQQQGMVEREPLAVVAPQVEPAAHCRNRWKAWWQHSPRQTTAQQVEDRLDDPPQRPLAWTAHVRGRWKERFQHSPLGIGQIAWQSQIRTGILRPSGVGPHRRTPEVCSKTA